MRPHLLVTTDDPSGQALVRGVESDVATRLICPDTRRYSRYPRGWVIQLDDVSELVTYAQYYRLLCVVHPLKRRWSE